MGVQPAQRASQLALPEVEDVERLKPKRCLKVGHLMRQPISGTQQAISRQSRGNPEVRQEATKGFVTFLRPLARSREPCRATRGSSSKSWCTLTKTLWGEDAVVSAYASW